jgi:hypothetical protein
LLGPLELSFALEPSFCFQQMNNQMQGGMGGMGGGNMNPAMMMNPMMGGMGGMDGMMNPMMVSAQPAPVPQGCCCF